ncbi:MAG: hypothetical protein V7605_2326 [Acidimicrobiaceae bacterium]
MRARTLLVVVVAMVMVGVASLSAGAGAQTGPARPGPADENEAAAAGRQARAGAGLSKAAGFAAATPASVGPQQFTSARVFATQYNPTPPGSFDVALPDKCAKFAALGLTSTLSATGCPPGYAVGLDYRVVVTRDNGQSAVIPLKDSGPWNIDDNYWDYGPNTPRPRRFAADLPPGVPETQAAFSNGYHSSANCLDLNGQPTGHAGGTDQFGRCVLNPAGIDLSRAAASQLGIAGNDWVTVTFLWEPLRNNMVSMSSGKLIDVAGASRAPGAPVIQWSANGGVNQQWRFLRLSADIFVIQSVNSGEVLDVAGASTADGAQVIQWPWNGGANQWWRFEPVGTAYRMVSMSSGKVIDVAGASSAEGGTVIQWPWNGGPNQQWRLSPTGNG